LNRHLIKNPAATFFVSVAADPMLKAALILGELVPEGRVQGNLFDQADRRKSRRLMRAIDAVNQKLPDSPLIWAAEGIDQPWQAKFAKRSKRYTTQWDELVEVE
jgi:DNA polymerase V